MKRAFRLSVLVPLSLLLAGLLPRPAAATTYQRMADTALADQAKAIAAVRVVRSGSAALGAGEPATDYEVQVERVVKGFLPGSSAVVRVPGGDGPDGIGRKIWGAPRFQPGERALLFLNPAPDGTYRILHLMLGAFHRRDATGVSLAVRDLSEARELVPGGKQAAGEVARDFDKFADWLADRAAGNKRASDYVVSGASLGSSMDKFVTMTGDDGREIRWFRFDQGQSVSWNVHDGGQPGLGTDATVAAFRTALQAWDDDPGSNVLYDYAGLTAASGGLARGDGVNAILFGDPSGSEVDGTFDCNAGGVIAKGGPSYYTATRSYQGQLYHEAIEADIVTNNGTECLFRNNSRVAEEVFAHELGHTLGLGHSKVQDALMYANIHDDGRGARLSSDDRAAIDSLYPVAGGSGGSGGGGGNGGGGTPGCTSGPAALCLAGGRFRVEVGWRNQHSGGTSGQGTLSRTSDTSGAVSFFDPSAVDLIVKVLDGRAVNSRFWVFAGSLTDVEFSLKVTDTQTGAVRIYHNRPGDTRGLADTAAFAPQGAAGTVTREIRALTPTAPAPAASSPANVAPSGCTNSANALCLAGRFRVEVNWRNQRNGATGLGGAIPRTGSTGAFWFFDRTNLELVLKALDGRGVNGKFWVFYGALTDVEYWVKVTDTKTGRVKLYHSLPGSLSGLADTQAF
jgi:Matrixin